MQKCRYILIIFLCSFFTVFSQVQESKEQFEIKGSVKGREKGTPIAGVFVSTDWGRQTTTDIFGEFKIKVKVGDILIIESPELETIRYTIKNNEDVDVLVEGYEKSVFNSKTSKSRGVSYNSLLDSANYYKKKDIKKSIDFITKSIAQLGKRADKERLATALTTLGEVYQHYKQYDLAIANYKDALEAQRTTKTTLLLGKAYLLNGDYKKAEATFLPLTKVRSRIPYEQIQVYEGMGDAYKGLGNVNKSVAFYNEGILIASKNRITHKLTDLNSKIAEAYEKDNKSVEAQGYYNNSLELAKKQTPKRAIKEKDKVADFYNKESKYDDEIQLRKESLEELNTLPGGIIKEEINSVDEEIISKQRINYKIANAYIAQEAYNEAIPYLEKSIKEAGDDDDLVVQKDATSKLSDVYGRIGEYSKAFETYKKYKEVTDTLYFRKEQEIARAARFNREIASKQSRISGLEQERELSQSKYDLALTSQELTRESNKRQKWIIYSLIFGMLLLGLAAFFFYRSNEKQKLANNLLALKSLRSQMNPHFIFNALNSVNNYIAKSDERSANRYLSEFSTLMRAVLENSEEDYISLSKELELLKLYTKLEHSRFADKFDYEIVVDEHIDIDAYKIPPMLLQPYIENAIWHGLRYKDEKGFLKISLTQENINKILITITDNGIGRKKSAELKTSNQKKQKSKGMGNIKKRVAILNDMYKDKVAVHISDLNNEESTGTIVKFSLKKE